MTERTGGSCGMESSAELETTVSMFFSSIDFVRKMRGGNGLLVNWAF